MALVEVSADLQTRSAEVVVMALVVAVESISAMAVQAAVVAVEVAVEDVPAVSCVAYWLEAAALEILVAWVICCSLS